MICLMDPDSDPGGIKPGKYTGLSGEYRTGNIKVRILLFYFVLVILNGVIMLF